MKNQLTREILFGAVGAMAVAICWIINVYTHWEPRYSQNTKIAKNVVKLANAHTDSIYSIVNRMDINNDSTLILQRDSILLLSGKKWALRTKTDTIR
jgi:hypothetical protein